MKAQQTKQIELPYIWKAKTYFWGGFGNGQSRSRKEEYYLSDIRDFFRCLGLSVTQSGNTVTGKSEGITVDFYLELSRKNCYISKTTVDGNGNKKSLAYLKKWAKARGIEIV